MSKKRLDYIEHFLSHESKLTKSSEHLLEEEDAIKTVFSQNANSKKSAI